VNEARRLRRFEGCAAAVRWRSFDTSGSCRAVVVSTHTVRRRGERRLPQSNP
jgi:hypothetical protein